MKRMQGFEVLHPFGWDAFGLPAENAAMQHPGLHPQRWTLDNIARSKRDLKMMGILYDWDREVTSCMPDYYKWTQWLFLLMLERGLAYRAMAPVNWCPVDKTVLANEQVINGRCWRHHDVAVEKRDLAQGFLKSTDYADRLLAALAPLHRRLRDQSGQRPKEPDLGRRLRALYMWHGRDHGGARARRARFRVRGPLRPADPRGHRPAERTAGRAAPRVSRVGDDGEQRPVRWPRLNSRLRSDLRLAGGKGHRQARGQVPSPRRAD